MLPTPTDSGVVGNKPMFVTNKHTTDMLLLLLLLLLLLMMMMTMMTYFVIYCTALQK